MRQETAKLLADGSGLLTAGTGVTSSAWGALEYWNFINTNAAGIGVLATLFFGFVAIAFNLYNSAKLAKADINEMIIDGHGDKLDDHIKETRKQFKSIDTSLNTILNSVNKGK